jgi:hypothetical protein
MRPQAIGLVLLLIAATLIVAMLVGMLTRSGMSPQIGGVL